MSEIKGEIMTRTDTDRGFEYWHFLDRYGQRCSLQQSSLAFEMALWLGVEIDVKGEPQLARMHLTRPQVRELIKRLRQWMRNGSFEIPRPPQKQLEENGGE